MVECFKLTLRDGSPAQISILANYIMAEIPNEPSLSEGAGDTAVRLLKRYRTAMQAAKDELDGHSSPGGYPAPERARLILAEALESE